MNHNKLLPRIKMVLSMSFSWALVVFFVPQIFIADSPQVRPDFIAKLQTNFLASSNSEGSSSGVGSQDTTTQGTENTNFFSNLFGGNLTKENLINSHPDKADLNYKPIGIGVYAAEDPVTKKRYIKVDKGTKLEKQYVQIDGQEVMIYVPTW